MIRRVSLVLSVAAVMAGSGPANAGTLFFPGLDVTTGGTASGFPNNFPVNEPPSAMFDDIRTTKGLIFNSADVTALAPVIWTYDFAATQEFQIVQYSLTSANDAIDRDPRNFFLEGSNDGSGWTIVDTVINHQFFDQPTVGDNTLPSPVTDQTRFETYFFDVDTPASFQQYRLRIVETFGVSNDRPQVAEMQMFTTAVPEPSAVGLLAVGALLGCRRSRKSIPSVAD